MQIVWNALVITLLMTPTAGFAEAVPKPKNAYLYIISPQDGAVVTRGFWCRFGLRNMGVTHAGSNFPKSGHHHLLIDVNEPVKANERIPQDKQHIHYGGGQTEGFIQLPPGKHTLQLVLGDGRHVTFDPPLVSKKITITVREPKARAAEVVKHVPMPPVRSPETLAPKGPTDDGKSEAATGASGEPRDGKAE
jgi:Domain of unknown function (DUF4399)